MPEDIKSTFTGKAPPLGILVLIISMASIGAVLFTPGLAPMAIFFKTPVATVQYAITIYMVGYAIAQLLHGPLANHFGRKPVLLWGCGFAVIFSLFSALSKPLDSLCVLMVSRFLTALSSGVGLVIALTMISDVYTEKKAAHIVPITAISFAVLPGIAICIGGFIVEFAGWDWCFYALSLYYLIGFLFALTLSETIHQEGRKKIVFTRVFSDYYKLITDRRLLSYAIMVALTTIFVYVYAAVAPVLTIKELGLHPSDYGIISLAPFLVYAAGNLITSIINKKGFPLKSSIMIAFSCIFLLAIVFFGDVMFHKLNLVFFYLLVCLIFFFVPTIWANASVRATAHITDKANSNAVLSFINVMGAVVGLLLVTETAWLSKEVSMAFIFAFAALALLALGVRNYRKYPK